MSLYVVLGEIQGDESVQVLHAISEELLQQVLGMRVFFATAHQCCPVGALGQTSWPFCILYSVPFPCRVHLAEEPSGLVEAFLQACWTENTKFLLQEKVELCLLRLCVGLDQ